MSGKDFVAVIMVISLVFYGFYALINPLKIMNVVAWWPKFILSAKIFPESVFTSKSRLAIKLMDSDPEEYKKQFWYQLLMIRLGGATALFMGIAVICIAVLGKIAEG